MKKRSLAFQWLHCICAVSFLTACGKNFYFAGRILPPSGVLNRVMVAIQNPSALSKGTLQFDDALYDIRHSFNNKVPLFTLVDIPAPCP